MKAVTTALRVHAVETTSRANGPGARFVIWVQGCSLGCPGCFNPSTHAPGDGRAIAVAELVAHIERTRDIEGVTISGGEPLEQPDALLELARGVRERTPLSILVFSGYTRAEIEALPLGREVIAAIDVLIDGRYVATERLARGLRGSANQTVQLITDRYAPEEIADTPEAEIKIRPDGSLVITGVDPLRSLHRSR